MQRVHHISFHYLAQDSILKEMNHTFNGIFNVVKLFLGLCTSHECSHLVWIQLQCFSAGSLLHSSAQLFCNGPTAHLKIRAQSKHPFLVDPSTQLPTLSYPYNEILTVFLPAPYWAFHPIVWAWDRSEGVVSLLWTPSARARSTLHRGR
jgi:hypothetical protein